MTLPKLDVLFASLPTGAPAEALARVRKDVNIVDQAGEWRPAGGAFHREMRGGSRGEHFQVRGQRLPERHRRRQGGIAMQDALRLGQLTQGDARIAIRIAIGEGDVAVQDRELVGELLALITRIEAITPADEIYLTAGRR